MRAYPTLVKIFLLISFVVVSIESFSSSRNPSFRRQTLIKPSEFRHDEYIHFNTKSTVLAAKESDGITFSSKDETILGVVGTKMSLIVLISEYVLKTTGCGLPAGPYGIIGALEGISYLGVSAIAAFSIYTKVKTGSGLKGVLGLAEGLSFLAIAVGLVVLGFQISDYGFIPNAVPTEGGICK